MNLQYNYVKQRRELGRRVKFFLTKEILADYAPAKNEGKHFLTKWTMDKSTEKRTQFAVATVNTENAECVSRGMCHVEGGYAKEIDIDDEEQTLRYKKKLQRSEEYRIQMTRNLESMKKAVMQNAGVNLYENYFESCSDCANVLQCYNNPNSEVQSPASKVSFSIEPSPKIAVAYSHSVYQLQEENIACPHVWDIIQNECSQLNCESSCSTLAFHKKYSNLISGGLQNGSVCIWDTRNATVPSISAKKTHQGNVNCLQWSHICNFEMLSGSSNGEVFLWDIRKMDEALCRFKIELIERDEKTTKLGGDDVSVNSECPSVNVCTSVEFDQINSELIRFGTGDGRVIFVNKSNNKIEKDIRCHESSISAVTQNWASYKCILTVDSSDVKLWGEDMTSDPIFSVSSMDNKFTCGAWSLTRYSRFFIGKIDGTIQLWDLTFNHNEPYFTLKPTCNRLNDIQTNSYGTLMACSCNNGDIYVIELLDNVPPSIRDVHVEEFDIGNEGSK